MHFKLGLIRERDFEAVESRLVAAADTRHEWTWGF